MTELSHGAAEMLACAYRTCSIDEYRANPYDFGRQGWNAFDGLCYIDHDLQVVRVAELNDLAAELGITCHDSACDYVDSITDGEDGYDRIEYPLSQAICDGTSAITHTHMSLKEAAETVAALRSEFSLETRIDMLRHSQLIER